MYLCSKVVAVRFLALGVLLFGSVGALAQSSDKRIDGIRALCSDIAKTTDAPADEAVNIFLVEIAVNSTNNPYPAVGIFNRRTKIFYTYGDREVDPYPGRLMRAVDVTERSARSETFDMCFDKSGGLVFAFITDNDPETEDTRLYFDGADLIRMTIGTKTGDVKSAASRKEQQRAIAEARRASDLFKGSLRETEN